MEVWEALRDAFTELGITSYGTVTTGGSTTIITDSALSLTADALIGGTLMLVSATDGLAPEGEFHKISDNDEGTITIDTALSANTTVGDIYFYISKQFHPDSLYVIFNMALKKLGKVGVKDTSITTASNQTEYTYPLALKKGAIRNIAIQGKIDDANKNLWLPIFDYELEPAAGGSTSLIIFDQFISGRTIKIEYIGLHPTVSAFGDDVNESIHPELMKASLKLVMQNMLADGALQTQKNFNLGFNKFNIELEDMKRLHPIWLPRKRGRILDLDPIHEPFIGEPNKVRLSRHHHHGRRW